MLSSPSRSLYLVAYDVACPRRLAKVHRFLLGWKVGGQKSFYECWLTPAELRELREGLAQLVDAGEDRVHVFQLDPRMSPRFFGVARAVSPQLFLVV